MNANAKLHPFLLTSLPQRRTALLRQYAERLVTFELTNERVEEHHYDEAQRLRLHRVIERQVQRGSLRERYAAVLGAVADGATDRAAATIRLSQLLEEDASGIVVREAASLDDLVRDYAAVLPKDSWPSLLCMASSRGDIEALEADLKSRGLEVRRSRLTGFGILHVACPPEVAAATRIAEMGRVASLADGSAPVLSPEPVSIVVEMADVRDSVGLTREMQDADQGLATIAVLDTGLDVSHPAFERLARSDYRNFTSWPPADEEGHGTHVASIAAGDGAFAGNEHGGIAPKCRLIVGKVVHGHGMGSLEQILEGMAWAVFDERADVLSLSIAEERTPANGQSIWSRACDEAFHQGTIVCVAAGNLREAPAHPGTVVVPGDAATAVTVGAVDKAGRLAPFSAQGSDDPHSPLYRRPTCVAPGVNVTAARSGASQEGAGLLVTYSGTSMAAPAVAGCLALLKSRARSLGWEIPPAELIDIFYSTCRAIDSESGEPYSPNFEIGHGLVDMTPAIEQLEQRAEAAVGIGRPPVTSTRDRIEIDGPQRPPAAVQTASRSEQVAPRDEHVLRESRARNTCYACGRRYLTEVGTFSEAWKCRTCDAPICGVCWPIGRRTCEQHIEAPGIAPPTPPKDAVVPPGIAQSARASSGDRPMSNQLPDPCAIVDDAVIAGQRFFDRFDQRATRVEELVNPVTAKAVRKSDPFHQTPLRKFGAVNRYNFMGGIKVSRLDLTHSDLSLIAVRVGEGGLQAKDGRCGPRTELLRSLPQELDFKDGGYYVVGVFSPVGWPATWTNFDHVGANFEVHLIECREGRWQVHGPDTEFRALFDPQSDKERLAGLKSALQGESRLVIPGDQMGLDEFCTAHGITPDFITRALAAQDLGYQVISQKGRSVIQRRHR